MIPSPYIYNRKAIFSTLLPCCFAHNLLNLFYSQFRNRKTLHSRIGIPPAKESRDWRWNHCDAIARRSRLLFVGIYWVRTCKEGSGIISKGARKLETDLPIRSRRNQASMYSLARRLTQVRSCIQGMHPLQLGSIYSNLSCYPWWGHLLLKRLRKSKKNFIMEDILVKPAALSMNSYSSFVIAPAMQFTYAIRSFFI